MEKLARIPAHVRQRLWQDCDACSPNTMSKVIIISVSSSWPPFVLQLPGVCALYEESLAGLITWFTYGLVFQQHECYYEGKIKKNGSY
jgi:hypothetical protein